MPTEYYWKNKKDFKKRHVKAIKIFLKKEKARNEHMVAKIFLKKKK